MEKSKKLSNTLILIFSFLVTIMSVVWAIYMICWEIPIFRGIIYPYGWNTLDESGNTHYSIVSYNLTKEKVEYFEFDNKRDYDVIYHNSYFKLYTKGLCGGFYAKVIPFESVLCD